MRSSQGATVLDRLTATLDTLAAADPATDDDRALKEQVCQLVTAANRVHAELTRRVDVLDRRGASRVDGFATAKS